MATPRFSLEEAKRLYDEGALKDRLDCKQYIQKFMFPTLEGHHFVLLGKTFQHYSKENIKEVYFNRLPKDISYWYFKENVVLYDVISDIFQPLIDHEKRKINLCSGLKHKTYKKYSEYSPEIRKNVDIFLGFIFEVICNNDKNSEKYVLSYISKMCKGGKNDACMYLKGVQGLGKSTLVKMIVNHILGPAVCLGAKVDVIKGLYNKILCGMLFVYFEELPTFSEREWDGVSSNLNDMITGTTLLYSEKYEKSFTAANINNYWILTNVDAIKHSHKRRYFPCDLNTKYREDHAYFAMIDKCCMNDQVGEALFSYLLEIDTTNFNSQADMPDTQNKLNAIADRLEPCYKFLKDCYVLKGKGIKCTVTELWEEYTTYCKGNDRKLLSKIKFNEKMSEVQIEYKKSSNNVYKVSHEELKNIATKFKWLHVFDEVAKEDDKPLIDLDINDEMELLREQIEKLTKANAEKDELIKSLQKQIAPPETETVIAPVKKVKKTIKEPKIKKKIQIDEESLTKDVDVMKRFLGFD